MASKEKIVHRQQFQNAQQTVEVTIKAKPRPKVCLKTKPKNPQISFIRDCKLKKELEKLNRMEELKNKENRNNLNVLENQKKVKRVPTTNVQIIKKSRRKEKTHDVLPPNMTWRELLESCSSSNISESMISNSRRNSSTSSLSPCNHSIPALDKPDNRISSKKCSSLQINDPGVDIAINNRDKQYQVHQSVQTSFQVPAPTALCVHPSANRIMPTPIQTSIDHNQVKNCTDQTYSPFGESALKLLHQLRERLQSQGDSEGSNIVSAIEAYFGTAASNSGNKDAPDRGSVSSSIFPTVFPTPHMQLPQKDPENAQLKRVVSEQERKLKEQEESIQELKSLSARLLAYHEQLTQKLIDDTKNVPSEEGAPKKAPKGEDSGIELSSSEDMQKALKQLTSERDALWKEIRSQRDIIFNLEVKLSESHKELNSERRKHTPSSTRPSSQQSNPPTTGDSEHLAQVESERDTNVGVPSAHLTRHTPIDSEADSAYDEKSERSSRTASKASCHDARGSQGKALSELGPFGSSKVNRECHDGRTKPRSSAPDYPVALSEGVQGMTVHEHTVKGGAMLLVPSGDLSLSFMSDVSAEAPRPRALPTPSENWELSSPTMYEAPLPGPPLSPSPERFLESTHVSEHLAKSGLSRPPFQRRRFQAQLSSLQSDSDSDSD